MQRQEAPVNQETIRQILKAGGAPGLLAQVRDLSMKDRNQALRIAVRTIAFGKWPQSSFDDMLVLGEAAVREALETGELDDANIMCFNMATNMADCWGDAYMREKRHFELGLVYASKALQLREQLAKPADKQGMAHWARGKHLLSLERWIDALAAMQASYTSWKAHAGENKDHEDLWGADAWLGLTQWVKGNPDGKTRYRNALDRLKAIYVSEEKRRDAAEIYIGQLRETERLMARSLV